MSPVKSPKTKAPKAPTAAASTVAIAAATITLQPGERYAGLLLDAEGQPSHHLVLLPPIAGRLTWSGAKDAAAAAGGELPTRSEQSLLFANLKGEFEDAWYWSSEEYEGNGSYAWYQLFTNGSQGNDRKCYEGRARAVRRVTV